MCVCACRWCVCVSVPSSARLPPWLPLPLRPLWSLLPHPLSPLLPPRCPLPPYPLPHPWPLPRQHQQVCNRRLPIPRTSLEFCKPLRCVTHARDAVAVAVRRAMFFCVCVDVSHVLGW